MSMENPLSLKLLVLYVKLPQFNLFISSTGSKALFIRGALDFQNRSIVGVQFLINYKLSAWSDLPHINRSIVATRN